MKKLCLLLSVLIILSLVSCNINGGEETTVPETNPQSTVTPPDTLPPVIIPETKPSETAPSETTPSVTAPSETKPSETKPLETNPSETTPSGIVGEASGSIKSDTGTSINLRAEYSVDGKTLKIDFYLDYYTLSVSAKTLTVTVNGQKYSYRVDAIEELGEGRHSTLLASGSYETDSYPVALTAIFPFRGTYAGVELDSITLSGEILKP